MPCLLRAKRQSKASGYRLGAEIVAGQTVVTLHNPFNPSDCPDDFEWAVRPII
ncbi:MAG: hypothetical protein J7L94_08610 [Caldisericaceae bacterium]|nr:hypothetical protein [Caldisericaceae bacterium]